MDPISSHPIKCNLDAAQKPWYGRISFNRSPGEGMKKTLECEATVLPDGHLAVPHEIGAEIAARRAAKVRLRIDLEEPIDDVRDGWEILRELPKTGGEGRSDRAAEDHDRILYGR